MGRVQEVIEENKTKGNRLQIFCTKCNRLTNHIVVVSADLSGNEDYDEGFCIGWASHYQVIQCQGCSTFSFRHLSWFSEHEDPYSGTDGNTERIYPKRDETSLPVREFSNVPAILRRIYRESIESFNNDCYTLCAAGLRSLVEGICADQKVVDGPLERQATDGGIKTVRAKNLEGKIAGLWEKGKLTKSGAETLHAHRYLGNDAVHELAEPSYIELKLAAEIIEHTLEQVYEIPQKSVELKQQAARRRVRK